MRQVKEFIMRPRNIYLSMVVMLTFVTVLASISFSFYVDESNNDVNHTKDIDVRFSCDLCDNSKVVLRPNETIEVTLYVMSNNDYKTDYKLYYVSDYQNVDVVSYDGLYKTIDAFDVHEVILSVENYEDNEVIVELGVVAGYLGNDIILPSKARDVIKG